jgi:hypothetical protein
MVSGSIFKPIDTSQSEGASGPLSASSRPLPAINIRPACILIEAERI